MPTQIKVFTDGGSRGNPGVAGAGFVVYDQLDNIIHQAAVFLGHKTNNEAEYLALLEALEFLLRFELKQPGEIVEANFFLDSKLVVEQVNRRWKIKKSQLLLLANKVWQNMETLPYSISVRHVLRQHNALADELANKAMDQSI